jgi:hypothetical protein
MCSRYLRAQLTAQSLPLLSDNPFDLAASTIDATSRLTSHSQGPGKVSSKSLISKMMLRSGVANPPKLRRWQSPHAWISISGLPFQVQPQVQLCCGSFDGALAVNRHP